jgi:very-short-patch-repair endonuclease
VRSQPSDRHNRRAYSQARVLRRPLTPAEAVLWKHLRGRRFAGLKFRRQQPVDHYIADLYCAAARLVVELDGETHVGKDIHDARRQAHLEGQGLRVIRFWNTAVYDDLDMVLEVIWELCDDPDRPTSLYPRDEAGLLPSPLAGEDGER